MAADRDSLVTFVNSKVGLPYIWGGVTDAGYDCSGLVQQAYASQGVEIPRVAQDQYNMSTKIDVSQLQPGDLVFFSDTGSVNNVTHVGMYIGNGQYTHAANSNSGVITSTLNTNGSWFVGAGSYGATASDYLKDWVLNTGSGVAYATSPEQAVISAATGYASAAATGNAGITADVVSWKDKAMEILGNIVKALTILLAFVLAAVFFVKAFDIKIGGIL